MANSVYPINKGINKSIEFKGLKAQYIWYLGGGLVGLLILFAVMYLIGINSFICVGIILIAGTILVMQVYRMSRRFGEYGLMKKLASKQIPRTIKVKSQELFTKMMRKSS